MGYAICIILSFPVVVMRQCVHWRITVVLIDPFSVWTRPPRRRLLCGCFVEVWSRRNEAVIDRDPRAPVYHFLLFVYRVSVLVVLHTLFYIQLFKHSFGKK